MKNKLCEDCANYANIDTSKYLYTEENCCLGFENPDESCEFYVEAKKREINNTPTEPTCNTKDLFGVELKPCPFCGGTANFTHSLTIDPVIDENGAYVDADLYYWESVRCSNCNAEIYSDNENEKEGITVDKWNTRTNISISNN